MNVGSDMPSADGLTFDIRQALLYGVPFCVDTSMHTTHDTFASVNISSSLRLIGSSDNVTSRL